jgi:hypothetical protein
MPLEDLRASFGAGFLAAAFAAFGADLGTGAAVGVEIGVVFEVAVGFGFGFDVEVGVGVGFEVGVAFGLEVEVELPAGAASADAPRHNTAQPRDVAPYVRSCLRPIFRGVAL